MFLYISEDKNKLKPWTRILLNQSSHVGDSSVRGFIFMAHRQGNIQYVVAQETKYLFIIIYSIYFPIEKFHTSVLVGKKYPATNSGFEIHHSNI